VPNQLLATSVPAFDQLLGQLIGLAAAEHEDTAMFNTTTVSGRADRALRRRPEYDGEHRRSARRKYSYSDILAVLAQAAACEGEGPFAWFFFGRGRSSSESGVGSICNRGR